MFGTPAQPAALARRLKALAVEVAELLKRKYPHSAVVVQNLQTGETIAVEYKPDIGRR